MRKTAVIIVLMFIFFILYFTQSNFFNWFTIAGIKPNLFVICVLLIGLYAGKRVGSIMGIIFGLLLDIFISKQIGISGILLGILGFAGGYFDKNFSKDSKITIIMMCIGATFFYEFLNYLILVFMYKMDFEFLAILRIIIIEAIYNSLIIVIIYPLSRNLGYRAEEIFKGTNILTRYF